jgi:3-oxoacyl-[acyl-carrier-protein] synthase-3
MAFLSFNQVGIKGLAACVPANRVVNRDYTETFSAEDAALITEKTGIEERRFSLPGTTAADLCFEAAHKLLNELEMDRSEVDALLFVSQTADYRMPASAIILQDRLGLSKDTLAFDINIGCSGYVYGLSVAFMYAQQPHIRKVLLLDGETRSRVYSPKDRKTAFLFGDGGTATLIEKQEDLGVSSLLMGSDGSRQDLIKMDAGGYRKPSSVDTLKEKVIDEHGNIRSDEHGYMNGADVFSFVLREIPKNFKNLLAKAGYDKDELDKFFFHQANKYMNDYLGKKLKVAPEKAPQSVHKYGNTSSVSIPLNIVDHYGGQEVENETWLLSGFGVGMSWATAILPVSGIKVLPIIEL